MIKEGKAIITLTTKYRSKHKLLLNYNLQGHPGRSHGGQHGVLTGFNIFVTEKYTDKIIIFVKLVYSKINDDLN